MLDSTFSAAMPPIGGPRRSRVTKKAIAGKAERRPFRKSGRQAAFNPDYSLKAISREIRENAKNNIKNGIFRFFGVVRGKEIFYYVIWVQSQNRKSQIANRKSKIPNRILHFGRGNL
ncbi:MAG: hypothetical protein IPK58_17460 [Acidobacteria bacterium]|nr:hypothetical protein [Acidobacteriota bacterium]